MTIKDDSFGDGLTLCGKPRRMRVDFDSSKPAEVEAHYIASMLLRRLSPFYVHAIRTLAECFLEEQALQEATQILTTTKPRNIAKPVITINGDDREGA